MIVSGIVGISSILLYTYLPDLLSTLISSQLVLKDGDDSILYQMWTKVPVAVDYQFFFYQINNPNEVLRGAKPRVSSVGPFCFKQWRTKKVVGWGENSETVKYLEYKANVFSTEGEGCKPTLDEEVTVINPPIAALGATIADIVREKVPLTAVSSPIIMSTMSAFLVAHQQNMFMKRTAKEILLGFRINLLDTVTTLLRPLELIGFRKEDLLPGGGVPNNTFGLMYGRNNTPEGPYEVYTGKNSHYKFLHLAKYKNKPTLSFWKSQYCNQVRGSDGSMWGAGVKKTDRLWAFSADVCRSLYLSYVREGEYKGIPTYVYGIDDTLFGNEVVEPKNECFCVHPDSKKHRCAISGILDIGACQAGAPLIVSKAEFLSTDPDLSLGVEGFAPNKEEHDSMVEVEPLTGIAVNGLKKLQYALRVENVPFLRGFNNMRNVTYIPFAMGVEKGGLPDDWADMMRNFLFMPLKFIYWGLLGSAGVAGFIAGRSGFRRVMKNRRARESVKQITNSAKNLYKKKNVVDSEISSIKSKNSMTDLIPRSNNNDNYANTTNVKLHLKNNEQQHQSNRFQQLSASRLVQPYYLNNNGQTMSYYPQIIPIIMPFPYQNNNENNRSDETNRQRSNDNMNYAPMITSLNSLTTPIQADSDLSGSDTMPHNLLSFNNYHYSRSNSIYPNIYPNIYPTTTNNIQSSSLNRDERRTSILKKIIPDNPPTNQNATNFNETLNTTSSVLKQTNAHHLPNLNQQQQKIESTAERRRRRRKDENADENRANLSSSDENLNNFEYNTYDDQYYYYNRKQTEEPTFNNLQTKLNEKEEDGLNQTINNPNNISQTNDNQIDDQNLVVESNLAESNLLEPINTEQSGHDQKKKTIDEFNVMYEDFKKIKKLGYDYNYYYD